MYQSLHFNYGSISRYFLIWVCEEMKKDSWQTDNLICLQILHPAQNVLGNYVSWFNFSRYFFWCPNYLNIFFESNSTQLFMNVDSPNRISACFHYIPHNLSILIRFPIVINHWALALRFNQKAWTPKPVN